MTPALPLLLAFLAAAGQAKGPASQPSIVYRCHNYMAGGEGPGGPLTLDKDFSEDGRVLRESVRLEGFDPTPQGGGGHHATAVLQWPGEHRLRRESRPLDWSEGSIMIYSSPPGPQRPRKGEKWGQTFVDRHQAVTSYESKGERYILLNGFDLLLAGELEPPSLAPQLRMSLDALFAWGQGVRSVTVYHTLVARRRATPNSYPTTPAGARRVAVSYEIDVPRLVERVAEVRRIAEAWEAGTTDYRKQCERAEESGGDIIVT